MNNGTRVIASLDIGSSKVCCVIAIKDDNDINRIIGLGYNESKGVSNGVISDFASASRSIFDAISEAEGKANLKINKVNISASSKNVTTHLFKKKIDIFEDRIKEQNINESLSLVLNEDYFNDRQVLHAAPITYSIDGANGIKNPVGMFGSSLEVEFIISSIGINHYKNFIECVTKSNVDIGQVIFSGLASGVAVLNDNEIDLGSAVLEIGATTTSLSIFSKGNFLYSDVINFGGNNISEAIARFYGISFLEAEKIKIMHASAIEHSADNEILFEVPSINLDNNEKFIQVSKKDLHLIVRPYLENILKWAKLVINKSGYENIISKQIVITGGGSQFDGLEILAKNNLEYNTRIGLPREFKIDIEENLHPGYSVALGIIQSILKVRKKEKNDVFNALMKKKNKFSMLRNWIGNNIF